MNYEALLARRVAAELPALFRAGSAAPKGVIPLTYGFPDPGSFPVEALIEATARTLRTRGHEALQYGPIAGPEPFLDLLVAKLRLEGLEVGHENLVVTAGGSQGIDLITHLLVDPGDAVVVEAPTFIGALQTFRNAEADVHEVPLDDAGLDTSALALLLERLSAAGRRPKFIYTIPTFHNPAGVTLSLERRRALVDLARRFGTLLIEDDAYSELRYDGVDAPSLYSLDSALDSERDGQGAVFQVRTFSKILAAGLRLGYIVAPRALLPRLLQLKVDVGTSPFATHVASAFAGDGAGQLDHLLGHIETLKGVYRQRRDAMLAALAEHAPPDVSWTVPQGGFFTWLTLPAGGDATALLPRATAAGVSYIPGASYFAHGDGRRHLRLAFSFLPPAELTEGVRRLCRVIATADD
ncbi:MAG: PLP-dependent aminotransferase family protein [Chloroflexota bacterium]|nr:PLP-dependent aminotransferase family protein [Chloroflexota bacterium]